MTGRDAPAGPSGGAKPEDGGPFVGREGELSILRRELERAADGAPRFVLVEGPGGVGKTRLVLRSLAERPDARVVRAWGDEGERGLAYGVLDQLWPALGSDPPAPLALSDPHAAGGQLLQAIGDAEADAVLVVVLDDLHWFDQASQRAVIFALRRLHADPVLVVACVRPEHAADLDPGFGRLIDAGRGIQLRLRGLDVAEIMDLAGRRGATLSSAAAARLLEHTDGNPLHLRAMLNEIPTEAVEDLDAELPAPRSFALLVLNRVAACSEEAERLVAAASVLRDRSSLSDLAHVAGIDDALPALQEAVDVGLLVSTVEEGGHRVSFDHPLVRSAVYEDLGPLRRNELHRRAVAVVDEASALLHRIAASPGNDEALAEELAGLAAREAQASAWPQAASHMFAAWHICPPGDRRDELLLDTVDIALGGGALRARDLYHAVDDLPESARRLYAKAAIGFSLGHIETAKKLASHAWKLASDSDEAVGLIAALRARIAAYVELRGEEAIQWVEIALREGFPFPWPHLVRPWAFLGFALTGRGDEALAFLEREWPAVRFGPFDGVGDHGVLRLLDDDYSSAIANLSVPSAYATMTLSPFALLTLSLQADAEFRAGDWDAASRHAELATSLAVESEQRWLLGQMHGIAALVHIHRGDLDRAEEHVREGLAVAEELGICTSMAYAATSAVELAAAHGDPEAVVEAAGPLLAMRDRDGICEPGLLRWREPYVEALIASQRLEEAEDELRDMEDLAMARRRRSAMANAGRVRAAFESANGRTHEATEAFEAGLRDAEDCAALDRGLFRLAYGAHLRRARRRKAAAEHLRVAAEIFDDLGAKPHAIRCGRELAACGLRPSPRKDRDVTQLTPQERTVAQLVASGLSNRAVAAELVVSQKTVEFHLSKVYAKLGIDSRTQLAPVFSGRSPGSED